MDEGVEARLAVLADGRGVAGVDEATARCGGGVRWLLFRWCVCCLPSFRGVEERIRAGKIFLGGQVDRVE